MVSIFLGSKILNSFLSSMYTFCFLSCSDLTYKQNKKVGLFTAKVKLQTLSSKYIFIVLAKIRTLGVQHITGR